MNKNVYLCISILAIFLLPTLLFSFVALDPAPNYLQNGTVYMRQNDDDDNNNGIADQAESSQVVGENDLIRIGISYTAFNEGTITLSCHHYSDGVSFNPRIWLSSDKSGGELEQRTWELSSETPPNYVYVENANYIMRLSYSGSYGYSSDDLPMKTVSAAIIWNNRWYREHFQLVNSNTSSNTASTMTLLFGVGNPPDPGGTLTMTLSSNLRVWKDFNKTIRLPNKLITHFSQGEDARFDIYIDSIKTSNSYGDNTIELKYERMDISYQQKS